MKTNFLIVLFASIFFCSYGQNDPEEEIKLYFQALKSGDKDIKAFADIYNSSYKLINQSSDIDQLRNLIKEQGEKFRQLRPTLGEFYGYVTLDSIIIENCIYSFEILARFKGHPVLYKIVFYKPLDEWKLYNLEFDLYL